MRASQHLRSACRRFSRTPHRGKLSRPSSWIRSLNFWEPSLPVGRCRRIIRCSSGCAACSTMFRRGQRRWGLGTKFRLHPAFRLLPAPCRRLWGPLPARYPSVRAPWCREPVPLGTKLAGTPPLLVNLLLSAWESKSLRVRYGSSWRRCRLNAMTCKPLTMPLLNSWKGCGLSAMDWRRSAMLSDLSATHCLNSWKGCGLSAMDCRRSAMLSDLSATHCRSSAILCRQSAMPYRQSTTSCEARQRGSSPRNAGVNVNVCAHSWSARQRSVRNSWNGRGLSAMHGSPSAVLLNLSAMDCSPSAIRCGQSAMLYRPR